MHYLCIMNHIFQDIKVIAFDADDTLWDNEGYFKQAEKDLNELLAPYADRETVERELFRIEIDNMEDYGYGAVAFIMSMIENAVKVSKGAIPSEDILKIIESGKNVLHMPATPYPGVVDTLRRLKESHRYQMVLFTKGELLTQENKIRRSGLGGYFDRTVIVSDKKECEYLNICSLYGIEPHQLLMVGNSLKSDVLPALNIGASAIYIPSELMWQHEVIESFTHERMVQLQTFSEILTVL